VAYFGSYDEAAGRAEIRRRLRRKPWTVLRLWLFIVRSRAGSDTTWWRDRDILYNAARLAAILDAHGITHVHVPWAGRYAIVAFAAARMCDLTFSVQARASEIHRTALAPFVPDHVRFAEFVITNARFNAAHLARILSPGSPPVHTIHEGVEIGRFEATRPRPDRPRLFRILSVARLVEPKGLRYLLEACHDLRARGVPFHCDIIGGPDRLDAATPVELRRLHTGLDLAGCVSFLGPKPFTFVLEALETADVFVLPSVRARDGSADVTPNSLIEAMARGLPVLSTSIGAIPEIVEDEVDGLLVAPGDARALADAILRLFHEGDLRARLGTAARRKVEARFDIDRNIRDVVALFEGLHAK
jgi:glycosyltransferase involved in cell wall biosynthesis